MDATEKLNEYLDELKVEYESWNKYLLAEGRNIDATKDINARMIVLRAHTETAFKYAFSLAKDVLVSMGGPLAMIEEVEKSIKLIKERGLQNESSVKQLQSKNENLERELAAVIRELNDLKKRVSYLESRPPEGAGPSAARARTRY